MNKFSVILKETYKKNVKSLGFLLMVLSPIVMIGIIGAIGYFAGTSGMDSIEAENTIAILSDQPDVYSFISDEAENIQEQFGLTVKEKIQTQEQAEQALKDETIAGYVNVDIKKGNVRGEYVHTESEVSDQMQRIGLLLTNYQTQLKAQSLGISAEEMATLNRPAEVVGKSIMIEDEVIEDPEVEARMADSFIRQGSAYFVGIGIFVFIMTYAAIIAEEIASEKGTRIMEVILSSVSSTTHFFGKLTAVLLVCLTQIMIYLVLGLLAFTQAKKITIVQELLSTINLKEILQSLLGYTLIFFILGVFLYVVMAAFFGSLVTKMEDVNKAVSPVIMIALAGFYGGIFALASPNNILIKIMSYIPLFTPFVMPFRIAADAVTDTGVLLSIGGMSLFTILVTWISLVLYRSNVLIYSDTSFFTTLKQSWTLFKSNRRTTHN